MEIALYYVLGRLADLAFARAVLALAGTLGDEPLFFHDPADDLLRHDNLLGFKGGVHPAVAVAPIAAVEHLRYADAQGGMLSGLKSAFF